MASKSVIPMTDVEEFIVEHDYSTFIIREAASQDLIDLNDSVKDACTELDNIIKTLGDLKSALEVNDGLIPQIDECIKNLKTKVQDFKDKNCEMFKAINQVSAYISDQSSTKAQKLSNVLSRIQNVKVYGAK